MITREEYIKALDIVEAYHKQIGLNGTNHALNAKKTKIAEWDKLDKCSARLAKNITELYKYINGQYMAIEYLEDVTEHLFLSSKGLGKNTWKEFQTLRGY